VLSRELWISRVTETRVQVGFLKVGSIAEEATLSCGWKFVGACHGGNPKKKKMLVDCGLFNLWDLQWTGVAS